MKENDLRLWDRIPPDTELVASDGPANEGLPTLTPYVLKGAEPLPTIIVCPGGGFRILAPIEGEPVAQWLNTIGYNSFVLNYRVFPYTPNTAVKDAVRSVRYLRHNASKLNINPDRIGMIGFSAGGRLAAFLGTHFENGETNPDSEFGKIITEMFTEKDPDQIDRTSAKLNAMVLCYADVLNTREKIIKAGREAPPQAVIDALSPLNHVSINTPPTFLWISQTDELVSYRENLGFAENLARHNVQIEFHLFAKGHHAVGLGVDQPGVSQWPKLCEIWLKNLWPEQ
jgi:acetyl esterase/lipase